MGIAINVLSCRKASNSELNFQSKTFRLNERIEDTRRKLELSKIPEYDNEDSVTYWTSFTGKGLRKGARYESCTLYFTYGKRSGQLGRVYVTYLFQQRITRKDLDALTLEVPVLKKLKDNSMHLKDENNAVFSAGVYNNESYPAVRVSLSK